MPNPHGKPNSGGEKRDLELLPLITFQRSPAKRASAHSQGINWLFQLLEATRIWALTQRPRSNQLKEIQLGIILKLEKFCTQESKTGISSPTNSFTHSYPRPHSYFTKSVLDLKISLLFLFSHENMGFIYL